MGRNTNPLQTKRFYKVKNPHKKFLCALCSAPRSMKYSKHLNHKQIVQIILLSVTASWATYPIVGLKSIFTIFLIWPLFEMVNKLLYRKEVACPYCGFDATWYRRDVKKANQLVKEFWSKNYPDLVNPPKVEELNQNGAAEQHLDIDAASQNVIN